MSDLGQRLQDDLKRALKERDRVRLETLRLVLSAVTNRRIELGREIADEDVLQILTRAEKQRREAEIQFREGGRGDLGDKEAAEAAVIREYLPERLTEDALVPLVDDAIAAAGATGAGDMGRVMGLLMPKIQGRADGAVVSALVRDRLK